VSKTKKPTKAKGKADEAYCYATRQYLDGNMREALYGVKAALDIDSTHVAAKLLKAKLTGKQPQPPHTILSDGTIVTTSKEGVVIHKDAKGHLLKGYSTHPEGGRERKGLPRRSRKSIEHLLDAIEYVEEVKKKSLYVHFVEKAFKNPMVLVALFKKLLPDLKAIDALVGAFGVLAPEDAQAIRDEFEKRFGVLRHREGDSRKLLESRDVTP